MLTTDNIVTVNVAINETTETAVEYDTGLIIGTTAGTQVATDRVVKYTSAADMLDDKFTATSDEYKAAVLYFAQDPAPTAVYVGYRASDETVTDCLEACYEVTGSFWGVFFCTLTDADILAAERWMTSNNKGFLFFGVAHSAENYTKYTDEDGVFQTLMDYNSRRAAGLYGNKVSDAAAWMGRVAGLTHAYADTSFSTCYKGLSGVETLSLLSAQVEMLESVNANVYVTRGYVYNVLEHATTGSGLRVDECLYLDTMTMDLKTAAVGLIVNRDGRLPQNDSSSTLFTAVLSDVLQGYANRDIIEQGSWTGTAVGSLTKGSRLTNGYYIYIAPYAEQTEADRAAHKAMPITICIHLVGSIECVEITVDVQR